MRLTLKTKFIFSPPKSSKILILDIYNKELIKILFNLQFKMIYYIHHYIKTVNPKIIITFTDNSIFFYKLKKDFPNIKFIAVQNGYRRRVGDIYDNLSKNKDKLMADYIFTFGKLTGDTYSKY